MRPDQLLRLEALRDKLVERSLVDADPVNWVAGDKTPKEMDREERGNSKWCRGIAINTVALTMQVQRLMSNPLTGGALVPTTPDAPSKPEADPVDDEIARYEAAAAEVLAARAVRVASDASKRKR